MGKSKMCNNFQGTHPQQQSNESPMKYAEQGGQYILDEDKPKPEVVYIRAIVAHTGKCGQVGVLIEQPGGHAVVVPSMSEIFKLKRYEKLEKYEQ